MCYLHSQEAISDLCGSGWGGEAGVKEWVWQMEPTVTRGLLLVASVVINSATP